MVRKTSKSISSSAKFASYFSRCSSLSKSDISIRVTQGGGKERKEGRRGKREAREEGKRGREGGGEDKRRGGEEGRGGGDEEIGNASCMHLYIIMSYVQYSGKTHYTHTCRLTDRQLQKYCIFGTQTHK